MKHEGAGHSPGPFAFPARVPMQRTQIALLIWCYLAILLMASSAAPRTLNFASALVGSAW